MAAPTSTPTGSTLSLKIGTRTVTLTIGRFARQADAAVWVREGDNVVLVAVVGARGPRPGTDFFPLTVDYREKMAAGGRIPGGFTRREGRISDREILASRIIDRSLRPLFPDGFRCEVQIQATVFSAAPGGDLESLALLGAGAALHLSPIPFDGPVAGCRSVVYRGRSVLLPVTAEREEAAADLVVSVGPFGLVMVEGEAHELPDQEMLDHLLATIETLEKLRDTMARWGDEWRGTAGEAKRAFTAPQPDAAWVSRLETACRGELAKALAIPGKQERHAAVAGARDAYLAGLAGQPNEAEIEAVPEIFRGLEKQLMRAQVVDAARRLDGRGPTDIRVIWGEVGLLPRAHGSALFTRGETQALVTCTLGAGSDAQQIETALGRHQETFLLHYNFPPFSVGEVRAQRGPGRREIGHGNLALRALGAVLPTHEDFAYTIRLESDILESNGSSSMATVCGGCLALMDAGVPIAKPVAGIAMGLIQEGERIAILSDILGDEDHLGDMDFKLCGTADGITALQMDNKIGGLTREVLEAAVAQARRGLDHVLERLGAILAAPRQALSKLAPQVHTLRIQPHLIGALIGPRGSTIKEIQETSGATVSVDDTGLVSVFAQEGTPAQKALTMIRQVAGEVRAGEVHKGTVSDVKEFGAFVRIFDSAEGLLPSEKLAGRRPSPGEEIEVRVVGADKRGRIELEPA